MILYYALGGGLGHVTRACAVLHTLYPQAAAVLLCSSLPSARFSVPVGVRLHMVPDAFARDLTAYRAWLMQLLAELRPQTVFLDTFPAGIRGEFCDVPELQDLVVYYVARRLRWNSYAQQIRGQVPTFHTTFCLEPLETNHQQFVERCSLSLMSLSLTDPPQPISDVEHATVTKLSVLAEPFWLIVHSSNTAEVSELIAYADELRHSEKSRSRLVVVSPEQNVPVTLPAPVQTLGFFPAQTLFPLAERVVSACGFNVMRQMAPFRHKHSYLPFGRRFDDQYWRAAYWRQR